MRCDSFRRSAGACGCDTARFTPPYSTYLFNTITRAAALFALALAPAFGAAATLTEGQALLDAGDFAGAAAVFQTVRDSGAAFERPRAAVEVLRAWNSAAREDQVSAEYDKSLTAAKDTDFEPQCLLERGKSLQNNAHDTTGALAVYGRILTEFPNEPYSASGALYQRGLIELDNLKSPTAALATFQDIVSRYAPANAAPAGSTSPSSTQNSELITQDSAASPSSPFVNDALVAECRAGVSLGRLDVIDAAQQRLRETQADAKLQQKAQFERAEFYAKPRADRIGAIAEYRKVYSEYPDGTEPAAVAKIRVADLVPGGDFRAALGLYRDVLEKHPGAHGFVYRWARMQTGIYQYQLGDAAAARATFESLLADKPVGIVKRECEKYLAGIADPDSTESLLITYDRAIRWSQTDQGMDRAFLEMQGVLSKCRKSRAVADFVANAKADREERAQMRYRRAYALYFSGHGREAFDLAQSILDTENPKGVTKWECLYLQAFLLGRMGEHQPAATRLQAIIDASPKIDFLPQIYEELAHHRRASGDLLGSVLTLEEMAVRFPARVEASRATEFNAETLKWNPELKPVVDERTPAIVARWQKRPTGEPAAPPGNKAVVRQEGEPEPVGVPAADAGSPEQRRPVADTDPAAATSSENQAGGAE